MHGQNHIKSILILASHLRLFTRWPLSLFLYQNLFLFQATSITCF